MEQLHICIIWILINIYLPLHLHKIISSGALMSMKIVTFATNVTVIIPWSQWKNKPTTGRKYPHPQYSQVNPLCSPDTVTFVACFTSLELKYELHWQLMNSIVHWKFHWNNEFIFQWNYISVSLAMILHLFFFLFSFSAFNWPSVWFLSWNGPL